MTTEIFLTIWCLCGAASAVLWWPGYRSVAVSWLAFLLGPVSLGPGLEEYFRSQGW